MRMGANSPSCSCGHFVDEKFCFGRLHPKHNINCLVGFGEFIFVLGWDHFELVSLL
jgi:hypothetical protein